MVDYRVSKGSWYTPCRVSGSCVVISCPRPLLTSVFSWFTTVTTAVPCIKLGHTSALRQCSAVVCSPAAGGHCGATNSSATYSATLLRSGASVKGHKRSRSLVIAISRATNSSATFSATLLRSSASVKGHKRSQSLVISISRATSSDSQHLSGMLIILKVFVSAQ
jgi:hypothetical protein